MNLNYFLIWFVLLSCIIGIVRVIRDPGPSVRGWLVIFLFILATTIAGVFILARVSGYVGGVLLAMLVLMPSIFARRMQTYTFQQQFGAARKMAMIVKWLHPADGWREFPESIRALELAQNGDFEKASEILQRQRKSPIWRTSVSQLYRIHNKWEEFLSFVHINVRENEMQRSPEILIPYLRALGEVGDLNGLLLAYERFKNTLARTQQPAMRDLGYLHVFAFCGKTDNVRRLFRNGPLSSYPSWVQNFWIATSELASGKKEEPLRVFKEIETNTDFIIRNSVQRRRTYPLKSVNDPLTLTPQARAILTQAGKEFEQQERYGTVSRKKAYATFSLVFLNLVAFSLEAFLGGTTDAATLEKLGALIPEAVFSGQLWRTLTALFLHYGFLHLFLNMFALYVLGPFLERALGVMQYLVTYFVAGIGSMLLIGILALGGEIRGELVVGASGAILGLVGATAAVLLRGWRMERALIARQRLVSILGIVLVQAVFDLVTPRVSFTGHLSGAAIGFVVAALLKHRVSKPFVTPASGRLLS